MYKLLIGAALAALASAAHAGPLTVTNSYGPIGTSPVQITAIDATANGTSASSQGTALQSATRFNTDNGILTGVKIRATASSANQSLTVNGTGGSGNGNRTAAGSGAGTLTVTSSASSGISGPVSIGTLACDTNSNNNVSPCPVTSGGGTSVTAQLNAPAASLANYADGANYMIGVTGEATANLSQLTNFSAGSATYNLTLGGIDVAVDYTYYEHAEADLSAEVIDFGTFELGADAGSQLFTITNGGGINAANLALTSITPGGDFDAFATAFPTITGLAGGASTSSTWFFNTSMVGAFEATYTLLFADVLPEGQTGVGARTYTKTLTLRGAVVPVSQVPEPAALGLFGLGLLGLGYRRTRKA